MNTNKPFTVDLCHKYYNHTYGPFKPGDRVSTTDVFTGNSTVNDKFMSGTVLSINDNTTYQVADFLENQGYTNHSVYIVKFDNGEELHIWPDEIKPEK